MSNHLKEVNLTFTINERVAPVIRVLYDKDSDSIEQKMLGILLSKAKSNNFTLVVDSVRQFSDGQEEFEIKVLGT